MEQREYSRLPAFDVEASQVPGIIKAWEGIESPEEYVTGKLGNLDSPKPAHQFFLDRAARLQTDELSLAYLMAALFTAEQIESLGLKLGEVEDRDIDVYLALIGETVDPDWENPVLNDAFRIAGMTPRSSFLEASANAIPVGSPNLTRATREIVAKYEQPLGESLTHGFVDAWNLSFLKYSQRIREMRRGSNS